MKKNTWKTYYLKELGEFKTSSVNKKVMENEIPTKLLNYMDVYNNSFIDSKISFSLTTAKESQLTNNNVLKGDVFFTPSSETRDDIGRSAVVVEDISNLVYSYHLVRYRMYSDDLVDLYYRAYCFNNTDILRQFSKLATGSTRYTLSLKDFEQIKIKVPSITEQQNIASILSTWDEAIEKYQNLLEHELLYRRELGRKVFNYDFFKKKDPKSKLYRISEVSYSVSGRPLEKYVRNEGKYKFISIGNYSVTGKYIDDGKRIILNEVTKKRVLNKNDLVMVLNDKTKEGNIIGTCLLIDEDERYIYNQRTQRIIVDSYKVLPVFMYYLLNSQLVKSQIFARSQGGTQIYVNYSEVEKIKVPIPSIEIQKTISSLMMLSDKKISSIQNMITQLQEQKRGLMQLLLTGKVRV